MEHIGLRIKARREELGITQEELARRLGYKSKSTINKIEMGINDISQKKIVLFAKALETTNAYLMSWDDRSEERKLGSEDAKLLKMYNLLSEEDKQTILNLIEKLSGQK